MHDAVGVRYSGNTLGPYQNFPDFSPTHPFPLGFDCLLWILSSLFYAFLFLVQLCFLLVNVIDSFPLFLGLFSDSSDCFLHFLHLHRCRSAFLPQFGSSREACFTFLAQSSTFLGFQPDSQTSLWIRLGGGTNAQNLFLMRHRYNRVFLLNHGKIQIMTGACLSCMMR